MLWPCPAARGILVLFCCHSIAESRPTLCDPTICNMPGSSVLHYRLLKLTSIESVMPSNHFILCCPLLLLPSIFPSISVFSNESAVSIRWSSIGASAPVFPMSIQDWFLLGLTGLIFLLSMGVAGVFFSTMVWKHQFFGAQPSLWSNSQIHMWLLEKP